jgi:flagellar biosynthetic protein FliO
MPMLLALLLVVFVIFCIALIAKKLNLTPNNSGHFKLISSMSLGGKERIVIIEVQGKQHAIGVTAQNVNHLFAVDTPIETKPLAMANSPLVNKINKLFGYTPPEPHVNKTQKMDK